MDWKEAYSQRMARENFLASKRYRMMKIRDEKFHHAKEKFKTPAYCCKKEKYETSKEA